MSCGRDYDEGCPSRGERRATARRSSKAFSFDPLTAEEEQEFRTALDKPAPADPKATDTQVGGSHYKGLAIQPAEYCQRNRLPYCESNVVKYVTRHREKNGREDIEKAIHYLQLLLEIEYPKP